MDNLKYDGLADAICSNREGTQSKDRRVASSTGIAPIELPLKIKSPSGKTASLLRFLNSRWQYDSAAGPAQIHARIESMLEGRRFAVETIDDPRGQFRPACRTPSICSRQRHL